MMTKVAILPNIKLVSSYVPVTILLRLNVEQACACLLSIRQTRQVHNYYIAVKLDQCIYDFGWHSLVTNSSALNGNISSICGFHTSLILS